MALHPDVQDKIIDEIEHTFESVEENVTDEKLKQLIYLDYAIKETLRFWTPVPFFARCTTDEIELGGLEIPIGCNIVVPIIKLHRDKQLWGDDADQFMPERFMPEKFEKIHSYAFMPFSKGSRNCIGYKYAENSMKVVLAHFFRNYRVSTELKLDDIKFEYTIVTKVIDGCMVKLEKRNFKSRNWSISPTTNL